MRPLVCLDEKPYQLLSHVREPLPATRTIPRREDHEALREQLRCKEIWAETADRYRNPEEDLPQDFDGTPPRAS